MKKIVFASIITFVLFASSCDKKDTAEGIRVEFSGAETALISNTELNVSIYGFDPNYADVSASLITRQVFNSDKIPFVVTIDVPNDPSKKIEYIDDANDASYYLELDWDSDGNGKNCNGDISADFEKNNGPGKLDLNSRKIQPFFLDIIKTLPCD